MITNVVLYDKLARVSILKWDLARASNSIQNRER